MSFSIDIKGLTKAYRTSAGEVRALDAIDLCIHEGERIGILGENGAGKSTLLQIIAGLAAPSAGQVDVSGKVHAALSLGVGLREELSGRENLYLDAEIQGIPRKEAHEHVARMIAFAELGAFIDQPVRIYSSGMKSRLTFASLVFVDPEILLIDEVLSAGDQFFQKKAAEAVRQLCTRGKIVIIVSHGVAALPGMCTRCIWMHHGRIEQDGDPQTVVQSYLEFERQRIEECALGDIHAREDEWTADGSSRINRLSLVRPGEPGAALDPTKSARVSIEFETERDLDRPALTLAMERMDGIVTSRNVFHPGNSSRLEAGRYAATSEITPLMLAPAYYLVHVELSDQDHPLARRSVVFRTELVDLPRGGVPLLFPELAVTAERVSPPHSERACGHHRAST